MDYLITMGIAVVLKSLKNKDTKQKFRDAFLKIRNAVNNAFAGDKDFQ